MKLAIVTLTKGACELGNQLCDRIGGTLYCKSDFISRPEALPVEKPFKAFAGRLFSEYDGLIFIMATGIVVRSLAPFIESKVSDPAVIVMDEAGKHAISLLSGHLGGGNALTQKVAKAVGAVPVITTASDVTGNLAVDMLAQDIGAVIGSMTAAKDVTAIGINGGRIDVFTSRNLPERVLSRMPGHVQIHIEEESMTEAIKSMTNEDAKKACVFISSKDIVVPKNCVQLIPRNYVVGIGCRRDTAAEVIKDVFLKACEQAGIHYEAVRQLATIHLKSDEKGILSLVDELGIHLKIIELDHIKEVQNRFKGSDFVEKTIGVRAVAEPCAMLAANEGFMRLKRYADRGVTIAIWEEDNAFKR